MMNINIIPSNFQPCVVIFTYNSEKDIQDCITSALLLSSDIVVIDLESSDKTLEVVEKMKIKAVVYPHTNYVETVRNFGIDIAPHDWIFILDADERITAELADELKKAATSLQFTYYKVPRKDYFAKTVFLEHGGWWPNHQIRFINRKFFKNWPKNIHSTPIIEGLQGFLQNPLLHYSKNDYNEVVSKTINFENIESDLLFQANKPVSTPIFFRKFFGELYRRMFKWQGYKDGTIGVIESIYQAFSKTILYLYLYEKKNSRSI